MKTSKTDESGNKNISVKSLSSDRKTNITLDYYNKNAEKFNQETLDVDFEDKQNVLLKYLNQGDHILDLGCGSGRDSKAFTQKGYRVTAIDGSKEICKIARKNIGQEVILKDFKDIDYVDEFHAIWACASIMHLPYSELEDIIYKISKALKTSGYLYSSFKYGNFEGEIKGRYFTYFNEDKFKTLINKFEKLELVEMKITNDVRKGRESEKWLNIVVRKK